MAVQYPIDLVPGGNLEIPNLETQKLSLKLSAPRLDYNGDAPCKVLDGADAEAPPLFRGTYFSTSSYWSTCDYTSYYHST
jgi:hypothetical protein